MAIELRKTGISVVGDVPWGTHFCHFYETKQDLFDTLVPYFKAGLESKEFCLWVVSNSLLITVEEAKGALQQAVPDLDRHLSDEHIEILNGLDWYLEKEVFNLEKLTNAWDAKLKRALARGYEGIRVSGDTFWLEEKHWKDFCTYEKQLNDSITDRPMTVLCTYPVAKSGAEVLDVVQSHQFAIARRQGEWEVIESPELIQTKAEINRLNEALGQRVAERTRELVAANEALKSEIDERRRVEEELRERAVDLAEAQRVAKIGNWSLDLRTNKLIWSAELYRICGIEKPDFDGRHESFVSLIHPDDQSRVLRADAQTRIHGSPFDIEYRIITPNHQVRIIREVGYATQDETGQVIRLFGTAQDITERRQANHPLRLFRTLIDSSTDAIEVIDPDTLRFLDCNKSAYQDLRYSREEFLSLSVYDIDPLFDERMSTRLIEEVDRSGFVLFESVHRRKDGSTFPVEVNLKTVRLEKDYTLAMVRDITERKQAEEKLKQSESQLAEAQRLAQVGYWERDIDSGEISWSDETYRIFGLQPQEPLENFEELIHPEDRPVQVEATARALRGEHYDVEYRVVRPDGEVRLVHSQGGAIRDESGGPRRAFGMVQDVTELKRAEEKLKATSEQLRALSVRVQSAREEEGTRIAREIHDELGAALSSLRWDLEGVDEAISESGNESQPEELRQKIEAMMRLTDTTINVVRRISSELRPIALDTLGLTEAIEWQARQFQDRTGIIVQCDCALEDVDLSREQSTAIFRIFQEALTNVLRHSEATRVGIAIREEGGEFVLTTSDNGRGITPAETSGTETLGLLGMRERAHLIGGEVNIAGIAGQGTVVTVRVPVSYPPGVKCSIS